MVHSYPVNLNRPNLIRTERSLRADLHVATSLCLFGRKQIEKKGREDHKERYEGKRNEIAEL